ncbi:MAG: DNA topoisomerase IV, partial [Actinobacteria bacterium]|nr:DNA topoisomerase IV [Actinomycetota bacterium]
ASAKARLIDVFDLSDVQATYILDMPLRRLTKFSRIELEKESGELTTTIEELTAILDDDGNLRQVVSDELAAVGQQHATPRRTLLLEANASPAKSAVPLEVDDAPCIVLMSSTGLLARSADTEFDASADIARAAHDVIVSSVPATARGEIGLVTSAGRVLRLSVLDLPALPSVIGIPALSAGAPIGAFVDLPANEQALCLTTLDETGCIALATARGTVKRVVADTPGSKDSWEVIRLEDGDRVVGAVRLDDAAARTAELVLVTSDGQLLRFPATAVRPQGRAAGGMAGINLASGASVIAFGAFTPTDDAMLITIAGTTAALPGIDTGSMKVTPFAEYPAKGRATGGVRCHRFRSGEDLLTLAWVGNGPVRACSSSGVPVPLPTELGKRDATGVPVAAPVSHVAGSL